MDDQAFPVSKVDDVATLARSVDNLSLNSYLPLGVVTAHITDAYPEKDCWTEAHPWADKAFKVVTQSSRIQPTGDELHQLTKARWLRLFHGCDQSNPRYSCLRIYVLPADVARRDVPRESTRLHGFMTKLLAWPIDTSHNAWNGYEQSSDLPRGSPELCCYQRSSPFNNESLFYIFNTIASPNADLSVLPDEWSYDAADQILRGRESSIGVRTSLYPYQRRSIVTMMQRETAPQASLDPRLEQHTSPTGQKYFFDRVTSQIFLEAAYYEEPRGGILAETMGYGKTLIVLGLVAATRDQIPRTPVEHTETRPFTNMFGTRSLMSMAAQCAIKNGLPWRQYFRDMAANGYYYDRCKEILQTPPYYEVISEPFRSTRTATQQLNTYKMILCKTTLVVVPPNLFDQWRAEIRKHLTPDTLDILEVKDDGFTLPNREALAKYDLILMDKRRFQKEMSMTSISLENDERPSGEHPLRRMHFLRLVVDEGHTFAHTGASNTNMEYITSLRADRRWVVSGTPSHGLVGVEVDLAAHATDQGNAGATAPAKLHADALERRKQQRVDDIKDLARLGRIVTELLRAQPWCNTLHSGDAASWSQYTRLGGANHGFYSAASVKSILQSLVVRHQIGDVEAELPPLNNRVVYLEPTMYDRASLDLFCFVLMSNAVTSERVDQDYLFHERNRKFLDALVMNLRRAPFFWSGFSITDIRKGLEVANKFSKEHPDLNASDRRVLDEALTVIPQIPDDSIWQAISESQEITFCVENLPQIIGAPLGIDSRSLLLVNAFQELTWDPEPLTTTTASRLLAMQKFCRDNASSHDPLRELQTVVDKIANTSEHSDRVLSGEKEKSADSKDKRPKGVPQLGDAQLSEKQFAKHKNLGSLKAEKSKKRSISEINRQRDELVVPANDIRLTGTVSAKLSYILSKVVELSHDEKILIFYEGDYIAWYVAQGLEALGVPHFIYANKIGAKMRNQYLETFMKDDSEERVMLIDLRQGSHGLNITSASRIFFVNPVWHVGTEAQAIKRAHRIGQTKPVFVETLILKDSIEQKIFERRRSMTPVEQAQATGNPLDDNDVHEMLKTFRFYGGHEDATDEKRFAPLNSKPLVFQQLAKSQDRDKVAALAQTSTEREDGAVVDTAADPAFEIRSDMPTSPPSSRPPKKVKKTVKSVGFA